MKFTLSDNRDRVIQAIRDAPNGMEVIIQPKKRTRSLEQNDKFHVELRELCEVTGYNMDEAKDWVKNQIGAYDYVEIEGKKIKRYKSSAKFSTLEMADAITITQQAIAFSRG